MNAKKIVRQCGALSLKEKEAPVHTVDLALKDHSERKMSFCWVGKVLYPSDWLTARLSSFSFCKDLNAVDRRRVLSGSLWSFHRCLMVLEEPICVEDISNMNFKQVKFWIQIHNVPLLCMNKEVALFLGGMVGEVKEIDVGPLGDCIEKCLPLRVVIEVGKPLQQCLMIDVKFLQGYDLSDESVVVLSSKDIYKFNLTGASD
ncbi:hypothetical protein Dsin_016120 [Dipteronia sinensis]|uniref:DUF4283 domain-containing protein n=1 Tax=Dipteronia sinensis TaxID=43782 RepID=A0AAE0E5B5_9ROSI|nr:hypothetical protein Dsin_016120 [Dipteronia sinensis]